MTISCLSSTTMAVVSFAWGAEWVRHSERVAESDLDSILCALRLLLFVECCEVAASKVLIEATFAFEDLDDIG